MAADFVLRWIPHAKRLLAGLLSSVLTVGLYLGGYLDFFDAQFADARFHIVRSDPSSQIALVAIDARSLNERPIWPWPRSWHAQVVDRLLDAGAAQIVLDIDFSAASSAVEDAALARALERGGERIILPVFQQPAEPKTDATVLSFPLAPLAAHARIASANLRADRDGIVREIGRFEEWGGALVPTLAAAAAGLSDASSSSFFIDFGIRANRFPIISYVDVLDGRVPPSMLAGKTVVVGSTALELGDIVATPVSGVSPGLMVQALATSSLLQGRDLRKVSPWLILLLTFVLFMAVERHHRRHWLVALGYGTAWLAGIFGLGAALQAALPVMIDVAPLMFSVVAALFASMIGRVRDLDLAILGQSIVLRRTSNLMRRVVENTFDGLLTLDNQGVIKSINPAGERILGRNSADLVERPFDARVFPLPAENLAAWLAYLADERQLREITIQGPQGHSVAAEIAVTRLPDEPTVAFVALIRDITERKAAAASAARNLGRLKDAIDSVASGFALFDADERLVMCNQKLRDLYPALVDLLVVGWRAEDLFRTEAALANPNAPPEEIDRLTANRLHRFRNPATPFEARIEDDRWIRVDERRTSEGGVVAVHTDITQARKYEANLRAARDQAEAANHSKSQFLANMSHELRTPLNAVIGFSDVMKAEMMGSLGSDAYRGYVADINNSATHLLSIINDILDISSIESGAPRLRESFVSLEEICESVSRLMSGRLQRADITMSVSTRGLRGGLWADGRLIKQMLINLVSNSIKFSAAGTKIALSVTETDDRAILLSVADEGIGIAEKDLDRILQPFEQVENAFTRGHDGVGLGLSLVHSMAEVHGATLQIKSAQGRGTTIAIAFPPERYRERPGSVIVDLARRRFKGPTP